MSEFLRFLLTSGIAAAVNLVSRIVFDIWMAYELAIVVAYGLGMFTAYFLAKLFVFDAKNSVAVKSEIYRFFIVNILALFIVWSVSILFARIVFPYLDFNWWPEHIAHLIGVASPAISSFYLHKSFTFKEKRTSLRNTSNGL